jgi:hypothetical protein
VFCGWTLAAPALVALVTAIPWRPGQAARREVACRAGTATPQPMRQGT